MDERKAFEDFCRHAFGPGEQHRIHGTGYMFWQAAWQAATAAERERCEQRKSTKGKEMSKSYCHADAETWDQFFARLDRLKEMESKNAALLADIEQYVRIASELGAEVDVLRKDAARYQWFRTHENWRDSGPYDHLYEEELDAAIDAAINKDRHDPEDRKTVSHPQLPKPR